VPDARDKIFISYRKRDAPGWATLIYFRLCSEFGKQRVFQDITIPPGADWRQRIESELDTCAVVVAVIGRHWASNPRLNKPDDLLRLELAVSLQKGIPVIPVLVDGAALPRPEELPDDLKGLLDWQALTIPEDDFERGLDRLVARLKVLLLRRTSIRILIGFSLAILAGIANFLLGAIWPTALGAVVLVLAVWLITDQVIWGKARTVRTGIKASEV
jgi:TIR domain-containing protein